MFDLVQGFLNDFVDILKIFIPMLLVFTIVGDLLFRER